MVILQRGRQTAVCPMQTDINTCMHYYNASASMHKVRTQMPTAKTLKMTPCMSTLYISIVQMVNNCRA